MKIIIILILLGTFVGTQTNRLRWRELLIIAGVVFMIVGWQTANIMFRYIGVE
jgi:hypothetical protein